MIIMFNEKHAPRFIEGETPEAICRKVLLDRIRDGFWYLGEELVAAEKAFDDGMCAPFIRSRSRFEYEGFEEIYVGKA
jgi:hypothetical protein